MPFGDASNGRHNLTAGAEATLERIVVNESALYWMKLASRGKPFDCCDLASVRCGGEHQTGVDAPTIHVHGAGTTFASVAPFLCSR